MSIPRKKGKRGRLKSLSVAQPTKVGEVGERACTAKRRRIVGVLRRHDDLHDSIYGSIERTYEILSLVSP